MKRGEREKVRERERGGERVRERGREGCMEYGRERETLGSGDLVSDS